MCCNVLEHLTDRRPLLEAFGSLVAPSAHLIVTVPRRFPYHADPIDTMYRPTVADLGAELSGFTLVSGEDRRNRNPMEVPVGRARRTNVAS